MNQLQRWEIIRKYGKHFCAKDSRRVFENIRLEKDGTAIVTNTHLMLAVEECHRMPEGFYQPNKFEQMDLGDATFPDYRKAIPTASSTPFLMRLTPEKVREISRKVKVMDRLRTTKSKQDDLAISDSRIKISFDSQKENLMLLSYCQRKSVMESMIEAEWNRRPEKFEAFTLSFNPYYFRLVFEAAEATGQEVEIYFSNEFQPLMILTEKILVMVTQLRK